MFFSLAIEVFKCLHQQAKRFLHWCANMVWGVKGTKGSFSILHTFHRQRVWMRLQHKPTHDFYLGVNDVTMCKSDFETCYCSSERFSRLGVFCRCLPLFLFDMLLVARGDSPLYVLHFMFSLIGGSFVLLEVGSSILFLNFPPFLGCFGLLFMCRVSSSFHVQNQ
jgi:hypothetical protein